MLENIEPAELRKTGRIYIDGDPRGFNVFIDGFAATGCSCRDVAALALTWAIGVLQRELALTLKAPGASNSVIGWPDEAMLDEMAYEQHQKANAEAVRG